RSAARDGHARAVERLLGPRRVRLLRRVRGVHGAVVRPADLAGGVDAATRAADRAHGTARVRRRRLAEPGPAVRPRLDAGPAPRPAVRAPARGPGGGPDGGAVRGV